MVRTYYDVQNSNRHNETKLIFLQFLKENDEKYHRPEEIADMTGFTVINTYRELQRLVGQGYIHRREIRKKYYYRFLKPMGMRALKQLWIKKQMNLPLKVKKIIDFNRLEEYRILEKIYDEEFKAKKT